MKIAIVSDTHNNWPNFKKAIEWISNPPAGGEKIKLILHCGDIQSQEIIDDAKKLFNGPASAEGSGMARDIKFVKGNTDYNLELPEKMELELGGKKIVFCHFPDMAKKLAQSGNYDLVFYGHTHRAWEELVLSEAEGKKCRMINPGELAGQFYKPTFAVYDTETEKLELKILEKL
jgi:putative phosphoesterase